MEGVSTMSIKAKRISKPQDCCDYPKLMKGGMNCVFMVNSDLQGMVVSYGDCSYYNGQLVNCRGMSMVDYSGSITLCNDAK